MSVGDVDTLVLTHMDGDHAGGALAGTWPDDVRAAFKRVVILDEALDWWRARTDPNLGRGLVAALERDGVLEPVASGHEFAPHLRLESAPGHRPGHAAVWIGDEFVHGGDILHVVEHVANPAWDYYYDTDVALALQTRQEWIDRLDRNRDAGALRAHRRPWPDRCRPRVAARAMSLVLGVDGGNTKTVALVAQADGTVVGAGRAGCADIYGAVSPEAAIDAIAGAAQSALEAAGATGDDLAAAVFCLAGADWPEDFELHRRELTARLSLRRPPTVFNDAIATLRAGTPDAVGVAAVVGTGGAIAGRNAAARPGTSGSGPTAWRRAGSHGRRCAPCTATGSGHDVPTTLTARACALYGVPDELELLHRFSRRGPRPAAVALVPVVFEEAAAGDEVARAIIETDASRFADAVRTTAARLGLAVPYALVLAGGVLRHPAATLHADAVAQGVPDAVAVRATWEPAAGALLLACDEVGSSPDPARLRESLPAEAFFATRSDP